METLRLIWNWTALVILVGAVIYSIYDLWQMRRRRRTTGMKQTILQLRRRRLLWLAVFLLCVAWRIERML